jgi:predicted ATPase
LIDWSFEALNDRDRTVFARLSVFAGGWNLGEARVVCAGPGVEAFDVVDAVSSLVDKSLAQAEPVGADVRYRLLETLRQYAADKLGEQPDAGASTRQLHADTFLALAEQSTDADGWVARMESEIDNLRAAMDWFLAAPDGSSGALRLGVALREFWTQRGHFTEGIEQLRTALATPAASDLGELRARALSALTELCLPRGEISLAMASIDEALAIARSIEDRVLTTEMLDWSAWLHYRRGDHDIARQLIDDAVDLARETGHGALLAMTRSHRGGMTSADDPDAASVDLGAALDFYRSVGNVERVVNTLNSLGLLALEHGDYASGRTRLQEAVVLAGDTMPHQQMYTLHNLGLAEFLAGDAAGALPRWRESLEVADALEAHQNLAYNLLDAAICVAIFGSSELAARLHGAADTLFEQLQESLEPLEAGVRERSVSELRAQLGSAAFDDAYVFGRSLSLQAAVALAREALSSIQAPAG